MISFSYRTLEYLSLKFIGAITSFILISFCVAIVSCQTGNPTEEQRPLVYEGMPTNELRQILGKPDTIEPGGTVYDANTESTKKVEKWVYQKRTVVVIDDTVKSPSTPGR